MGVGGTGLMACACDDVAIPMHNARLAMNHDIFSAGIPTFSLRHESIQYVATRRVKGLVQVLNREDHVKDRRESVRFQHTGLSERYRQSANP
jgi:hypothetical protein